MGGLLSTSLWGEPGKCSLLRFQGPHHDLRDRTLLPHRAGRASAARNPGRVCRVLLLLSRISECEDETLREHLLEEHRAVQLRDHHSRCSERVCERERVCVCVCVCVCACERENDRQTDRERERETTGDGAAARPPQPLLTPIGNQLGRKLVRA